jgi:cytochrome b6-f complex iron-sulfur subunit
MAERIITPSSSSGLLGPEPAARPADTLWSRRDVFSITGWAGLAAVVGAGSLAFTRFMFPRVLFEPDPTFNAGRPEEYVVGAVDERWKLAKRVWIVRTPEGFYALQAICTHLGCTPNWLNAEDKFKCPCHGSGFRRTGVNFEGPAPRPLERLKISLAPDGQLLVDRSVRFRAEKGEWDKPGAFLTA